MEQKRSRLSAVEQAPMSTQLLAVNPASGGEQLSWGVTAHRARLVVTVLSVPNRLDYGAVASLFAARGDAGPPVAEFKH